jgi:hypothetical protein
MIALPSTISFSLSSSHHNVNRTNRKTTSRNRARTQASRRGHKCVIRGRNNAASAHLIIRVGRRKPIDLDVRVSLEIRPMMLLKHSSTCSNRAAVLTSLKLSMSSCALRLSQRSLMFIFILNTSSFSAMTSLIMCRRNAIAISLEVMPRDIAFSS